MKANNVFQIAELINKGKGSEITKETQADIKLEIAQLLNSRDKISELLKVLFPNGIPIDSTYYKHLFDLLFQLGLNSETKRLIGFLLIETYKSLKTQEGEKLLQLIIDDNKVDFFNALLALPCFFEEVEISPDFASKWFSSYAGKIQGDLAGGEFYEAVKNYAYNFPGSGLKIVEKYCSEKLDELKLHLAALIFGEVRSASGAGRISKEVVEIWEKQLLADHRVEARLICHRSWMFTCSKLDIDIPLLEKQLKMMLQGDEKEIDESFNVVGRCLLTKLTVQTFVTFAIKWLKEHSSGSIADTAKYVIVDTMWRAAKKMDGTFLINIDDANELILKIQPIPLQNRGTWNLLEYYLVDRLHDNKDVFAAFLKLLIEANPTGLLEQFESQYSYLISEMGKPDLSWMIIELMFSRSDVQRRLGNILFQKIKFLPQDSFENIQKIDEIQLSLGLWEFVRRPYILGKDVSKLFIMLEPRFRSTNPELQEEFKHEMLMQAINYPGDCLEDWKKVPNPSALLENVIQMADRYFENLKKVWNSPANSFTFPEFNQAAEKGRKEYSKKLAEGVEQKSVFSKLAKHIDVIYGKQWSVMYQDKMGTPTEFKEFSHSFEFPRMEEIDPEGSSIRRMLASVRIKNLQSKK